MRGVEQARGVARPSGMASRLGALALLAITLSSTAALAKPATGTVSGKVVFAGTPPPRKSVVRDSDPVCAKTEALTEDLIVSDQGGLKDVLVRVVSLHRDPLTTPVAHVMTIDPITIDASTPVEDVLDQHSGKEFRHLPVMEEGQLIGHSRGGQQGIQPFPTGGMAMGATTADKGDFLAHDSP